MFGQICVRKSGNRVLYIFHVKEFLGIHNKSFITIFFGRDLENDVC